MKLINSKILRKTILFCFTSIFSCFFLLAHANQIKKDDQVRFDRSDILKTSDELQMEILLINKDYSKKDQCVSCHLNSESPGNKNNNYRIFKNNNL